MAVWIEVFLVSANRNRTILVLYVSFIIQYRAEPWVYALQLPPNLSVFVKIHRWIIVGGSRPHSCTVRTSIGRIDTGALDPVTGT